MTCLKDLTNVVDIKTSSRPAMIGSLTDGSTETFWESGDEDKNKTKSITISCVKGINASNVSVHVDNSRDIGVRNCKPGIKVETLLILIFCLIIMKIFPLLLNPQNKVTSVTFLCGKAIEDLCRIKQVYFCFYFSAQ